MKIVTCFGRMKFSSISISVGLIIKLEMIKTNSTQHIHVPAYNYSYIPLPHKD